MVISGCHEGKHTPRLSEVKCPNCGEWVDVFVIMGPRLNRLLASDEKCSCGCVFLSSSVETDYEQ